MTGILAEEVVTVLGTAVGCAVGISGWALLQVIQLKTSHARLEAMSESIKENVSQRLAGIDRRLATLDEKMDRILEAGCGTNKRD